MLRHRSHRRFRTEDPSSAFSSTSIFITPMLDMSFQILAFFVFTYQPAPPEGQFPIVLAAGEAGGEVRPKDPKQPASPGEPALRPLVSVQAKAEPNGDLRQVEVLYAGKRHRVSFEGRAAVPLEKFVEGLQQRLLEIRHEYPKNPADPRSLSLLFVANDGLRWEQSMALMDACRRATVNGESVELFPKLELDFLRQ